MEQLLLNNVAPSVNDARQSFSLRQQISRWFLSVLSVAFLMASFKIYENKGNLTSSQINTFYAITTVLSLLLALAFFDAFKDLAKASRWRILVIRGWSDSEKQSIRKIAKWTAVFELGRQELVLESRAKRWVIFACLFWMSDPDIIFNIAAQTAVALINQVFSVQDGTDWTGTYIRPDQVNAPNLTCYYHHLYFARSFVCDPSPETVHGIVHAYGEYAIGSLSEGSDCVYYNDTGDVLHSQANPKHFCRRTSGQQEFAYRFLEYNPQDHQRAYPFLTNRMITTSAGECYTYSVTKVVTGTVESGKWSNYTYTNNTITDSILLPVKTDTFDGTVYIYRGFRTPQTETTWRCGDRCIWMWAHKTVNDKNPSPFYQCPVTVNRVQNSEQDAHNISNDIASLAASAIGLEGGKSDSQTGWSSFQFYPISDAWDIHGQPAENVSANMAEFALGSIATMATNNPTIRIPGNLPIPGSRLKITWAFAIALLVCIAGVHSLLFLLAIRADRWNRNHARDESEQFTSAEPD